MGLNPGPDLALLGPGAPGLDKAMALAEDAASYRRVVASLIVDAAARQLLGQRIKAQILSQHIGEGWVHNVRDLYTSIEHSRPRGCFIESTDFFDTGPLDLALDQLYAHAHDPMHVLKLIRTYVGALRYPSRLSISRRLHREGFGISWLSLLPPPLNAIARGVGRPMKRVLGRLGNIG